MERVEGCLVGDGGESVDRVSVKEDNKGLGVVECLFFF